MRIFRNAPLAIRSGDCYNRGVLPRNLLVFVFVYLLCVGQRGLLAQNSAVIDQARLFRDANAPGSLRGEATDTALPEQDESVSEDDSMGVQQILKEQKQRPTFAISAGLSEVFTSNAALTRRDERPDLFGVAELGASWTPRLSPTVEVNAGAHASLFRYVRTPELDFENLGVGAGLAWTPAALGGISFFARYDLTELLGSDGSHILTDHIFSGGVQKVFTFARAHALTVGASGSLGFSNPDTAQRHQAGGFVNYHVQIARDFGADLLWRPAGHFYQELDRTDFNNILSLTLRYRITPHADLSVFASYGANRSEDTAFDYNVATTGAGVVFTARF